MPKSKHLFKRYIAQSSDFDAFIIDVDKAEGSYIWDQEGKRYLDFTAGMCSNNLGNRHPDILRAMEVQMGRYLHTMVYGEFIQEPQIKYAEALCKQLPENLQMLFYVNSGSEAIEGAIKLARLHTGKTHRISFNHSYHGSTLGAMSMLGSERFRSAFEPLLPHHSHLPYNDPSAIAQIDQQTACVVMELMQSGAGMNPVEPGFLQAVADRCHQMGALLIFDEIQTGFGRTGKLFAFEHYGVSPDILCVAKSMGGGLPLGAFIASEALMESLNNGHPLVGHATTFGGHPLSCAAGLAALKVISDSRFLEAVARKEHLVRTLFSHPKVERITGKGLFLAAHLQKPEHAECLVKNCVDKGLILLWVLFNHGAIALTPALNIEDHLLEEASLIFKEALDQIPD